MKHEIPVRIVIRKEKVKCWVSEFGGWGSSSGYAGVVKDVEIWTLDSWHRVSVFDRVSDNGLLDVTNLVRLPSSESTASDLKIENGYVEIEGVLYQIPLESAGAVYVEPNSKFGWGVDFSKNRSDKSTVEKNRDIHPDLFEKQKFGSK